MREKGVGCDGVGSGRGEERGIGSETERGK